MLTTLLERDVELTPSPGAGTGRRPRSSASTPTTWAAPRRSLAMDVHLARHLSAALALVAAPVADAGADDEPLAPDDSRGRRRGSQRHEDPARGRRRPPPCGCPRCQDTSVTPPPGEVAAWMRSHRPRLDVDVEVQGYGGGRLGIVVGRLRVVDAPTGRPPAARVAYPRAMTSAAVNHPRTGSPVEAVDRALLVLQALATAGPDGCALADLAVRLEVNKTTLHRVLAALKFRDFVVQDLASGHYALGPAVASLADQYFGEDNLPGAAAPRPARARRRGRRAGPPRRAHRRARALPRQGRAGPGHPGVVRGRPPHAGGDDGARPGPPGLPRHRPRHARQLPAGRGGPRPVDADHVWETLELARARGYAMEDQENEPGITCVAVPLLRAGTAVAAVSVTAPAERMSAERVRRIHERMRAVLPPLLPPGLRLPGARAAARGPSPVRASRRPRRRPARTGLASVPESTSRPDVDAPAARDGPDVSRRT